MSQVRVSDNAYGKLQLLASEEGKSMIDIIEQAIEDYRRKTFLEKVSEDFRTLRADPEAWKDYQADIGPWEALQDGLDEA